MSFGHAGYGHHRRHRGLSRPALIGCVVATLLVGLAIPCVGLVVWLVAEGSMPSVPEAQRQIDNTRPFLGSVPKPARDIPVKVIVPSQFKGLRLEVQTSTRPYTYYQVGAKLHNGTTSSIGEVKADVRLLDRRGKVIGSEEELLRSSYGPPPLRPGEMALVSALVPAKDAMPDRVVVKIETVGMTSTKKLPKGKRAKVRWLLDKPPGVDLRIVRRASSIKKQTFEPEKGKIDHTLALEITNTGTKPIGNLGLQKRLFDKRGTPVWAGLIEGTPSNTILEPGDAVVINANSYGHAKFAKTEIVVVKLSTLR